MERHDIVRDNLEYGRFEWHGPVTAIQYVERILLESRQLTPALTDRQLIRKISRHFGRDLQIAVITRGIVTIPNFEALITEYTSIQSNSAGNRRTQYRTTNERETGTSERPIGNFVNKNEGERKPVWQGRPHGGNRYENKQHGMVNTVEYINSKPSTSHATDDNNSRSNNDQNSKKKNTPTQRTT